MYLPPAGSEKQTKQVSCVSFLGYDEREKIDERQFSNMLNMSSDSLPCAAPRKPRLKINAPQNISALALPEYTDADLSSFTGVAGGRFYYCGSAISNITLSSGEKSIVDFNGNICIFPDKVYYRYLPDPDTGVVDTGLKTMAKSLAVSGASFYSSYNEISGEYSAYIRKTGAGFDEVFSPGDSVVISGCQNSQNNTFVLNSKKSYAADSQIVSAVVDTVSGSTLNLLMYTKTGKPALFKNTSESSAVTIETAIPDIKCACVQGNRLFGASENGEFIYASKLGDCFNFNSFQGLASDSWYCEIGTPGGFLGIVSYRTSVVAFKRGYIHHVYGDSPENFSVPKQTLSGTVDGKSIAEVGGVLYYLAADGFYEYSGGEPEKISLPLKTKFKSCKSGTDGIKYYACAEDMSGAHSLLVYDPYYRIWHKEDDTDFIDFIRHGDKIYGVTQNKMFKFGSEDGDEVYSWCVVSKNFTLEDFDFKGVNAAYIRIQSEPEAEIKVSFSTDGSDFVDCGEISGGGFMTYRIPIRFKKCDSFRIMLYGTGRATIHDMEIITYTGGRTNVKHIR